MVTGSDVFGGELHARLVRARDMAVAALLRERGPKGYWVGELSASALSTATAVVALALVSRNDKQQRAQLEPLLQRGFAWLVRHQNGDGGWGDTLRSHSNISTTALVWAALGLEEARGVGVVAAESAGQWLTRAAGSLEPEALVDAIERRYGDDRTFSIPILTMCALCGRLGPQPEAWRFVRQLPFELAALPQAWFGAMRLPVVSYALPALIAIGQVRHGLRPTANPIARAVRERCRVRTLQKLQQLQPENGGFLEATPLTSFVTMSLAALGLTDHPVVQRGVSFIVESARVEGSWAIDTNLATWVSTLSVNALGAADATAWSEEERSALCAWLLQQQYRAVHPYTLAAPGGWAWTDLPGGVPDADDTPGAILALLRLAPRSVAVKSAVESAVGWLLDLQNADGGIPTFCRGWGRLPFDRSSPDLTAHTLRAWRASLAAVSGPVRERIGKAQKRALRFLLRTQRADGSWSPLWFGHQDHPEEENPLYGTSRVVLALVEQTHDGETGPALARALGWLVAAQHPDGGWSAAAGALPSVEETGLVVEALAAAWRHGANDPALAAALSRGGAWLAEAIEHERWRSATPIGFYFAKLWYFERLYPLIFATAALTRCLKPSINR
ncbi:MAG TPA: prenyltransferase/squalene oxidase repeat-containing protein [Opitutaceae bacterium]